MQARVFFIPVIASILFGCAAYETDPAQIVKEKYRAFSIKSDRSAKKNRDYILKYIGNCFTGKNYEAEKSRPMPWREIRSPSGKKIYRISLIGAPLGTVVAVFEVEEAENGSVVRKYVGLFSKLEASAVGRFKRVLSGHDKGCW